MGTETTKEWVDADSYRIPHVKLNNPLMGTETLWQLKLLKEKLTQS